MPPLRCHSAPAGLAHLAASPRGPAYPAEAFGQPAATIEQAGALPRTEQAPDARQRLADASTAYLALRAIDKRAHFDALDKTVQAALAGPLEAQELAAFQESCHRIFELERQAMDHLLVYTRTLRELRDLHCLHAGAPNTVPWLAGGELPADSDEEWSRIERLLVTEQMTKATQAQVFGGELGKIFDAALPPGETAIVVRAAQRFLNALTLVLDSSLSGAAIGNLQALESMLAAPQVPDSDTPACIVATAQSVRQSLLPRLEAAARHIFAPGGIPTLSPRAAQALRQSCQAIVEIVDSYRLFDVPRTLAP